MRLRSTGLVTFMKCMTWSSKWSGCQNQASFGLMYHGGFDDLWEAMGDYNVNSIGISMNKRSFHRKSSSA